MLLEPAAVAALDKAFAAEHPQPVFTYLANTIAGAGHEIPYSTITAIDFATQPPLGPFTTPEEQTIEPLADDEIALNTWAAEDLGVHPGDTIEITYFEPESTHAQVREQKQAFRLKAIVAMTGVAADKDLTPQMPGVTDRLSIGDWDAPFPFDAGRVRKKDEQYWDDYRTTPKAFVSLATGRRLWSSRFGNTTAIRFVPPAGTRSPSCVRGCTSIRRRSAFAFCRSSSWGWKPPRGTTPFDALFVGFSLFIMVSAIMLVAILFRLGVDRRAAQIGIFCAIGLRNRQVFAVLAGEGLLTIAAGSVIGVAAGVGYAG